jgi:hypothetical protein
MADQTPQTLSVPQAGKRYFGLSRNASYAAAQRGQLPIIRIGRLLRVPVRAMERMLDQASDKPAAHPFINSINRRPAKKMPGRTDMRTRQKEVTRGRYTIGADPQ